MATLFNPLTLREVTLRNRMGVSPMCQYSCAPDGLANDWHLVHLGSRAVGGAGLVFTEAAAVEPRGRISPGDLGIWSDAHAEALSRIARFITTMGAVPGIQLAHAGRKASTKIPWKGDGTVTLSEGGWETIAPSPIPFSETYPPTREMTLEDIDTVLHAFTAAARRSLDAGFRVLELHAAHGYLLHSFLSPLSNHREDAYGGSFEARIRLLIRCVESVRGLDHGAALFVRVSATDWTEGGWTPEDTVSLARRLETLGVDVLDCSSGGILPGVSIPVGPGYQTPFAERVRREAGLPTAAVGLITSAEQAEAIVSEGRADVVLLAREELRTPYFPLQAGAALGDERAAWPVQYERGRPRRS